MWASVLRFLPKHKGNLGRCMSVRASVLRSEHTAPFWEAPLSRALPLYQEGFLPRTASVSQAEPTRTETAPVRFQMAPSGAGDSLVFLHETSSVRGALEEMVHRNTAFVLVVGDPFNRSSPKADVPASTSDIVRISSEAEGDDQRVDTEHAAVIGLFTERDLLRCLADAVAEQRTGEAAALSFRLRKAMSPLYDRFGTLKVSSNTIYDAVMVMRERNIQTIPIIREEEHEEDYILPGGHPAAGESASSSYTLALPPRSFCGVLTARDVARFFLAQDASVQDAVCSLETSTDAGVRASRSTRPMLLRHLLSWRLRRLFEGARPLSDTFLEEDIVVYESEHYRVVSVPRSASVRDAIAVMAQHDVRTLLISEDASSGFDAAGPYPSIYGVITLRDLMRQVFYPRRNPLALSMQTLFRERWTAAGVSRPQLAAEERKYGISPDDEVAHALRLVGGMNERHIPVYVYNDADQTSNCVAMVSVKEMLSGVHAAEQRRRGQRY
ncbi:hypothetical protein CYME_CMQ203C [Cyanidioschyzon merolae strain 10D]|uniref:CBS domain-containing protein n=1 Tax=Cyanidioschyzon merolae (strain NIES-3377 / 10D) TaxID=280699 RepID=M1V6D2_CYAM1|nr:hypothetical protein CYME_CMQ203C [Cyanidioschyzon merolae strain 10D]BAM82100.1 hypothetical protein CYME_CMQ203C [Cyanidioschyzon merolae strain 10D]|eukprot:XP_005538136.1 hypothetical protein CYME_CMQ203C [Cyanidioschyzon merolae strain 10D]